MVEKYLQELYKLYTEQPFLTYEKLIEYLSEIYSIDITYHKLREIMMSKFPNIKEKQKYNRKEAIEQSLYIKDKDIFTKDQIQKLHELLTTPPYMNYMDLCEYSYKHFNIDIYYQKLKSIISAYFPNISEEIKSVKNDRYFYRDGKKITADDRKQIIELLADGNTQAYVASILDINRSTVSRILKKSQLEIEDIKKSRVLAKIEKVNINEIKIYWNNNYNIRKLYTMLLDRGCIITEKDTKYLLKYILNVCKRCKICGKEIEIENNSIYCSDKCKIDARQDSRRTQQYNRRVKGNGKTTQSISRGKKISEVNGICYLCGENLDRTIKDIYHPLYIVLDHIEALSQSNDTSEDNIKPVCRCCNNMKSNKPKDYYKIEDYRMNKINKVQQYVPKENKHNLIDTEAFIKDCNNGMTMKELCEKYDRSSPIIYRTKKNLKLVKNQKTHTRLDEAYSLKEVVRLTKEGKRLKDISEIMGISTATVSNIKKKCISQGLLENSEVYLIERVNKNRESIFSLIKEGKTNKEISEILCINVSTAWKYRQEFNENTKYH